MRGLIGFAVILALLVGVSLLPPDTSLREIERAGVLRACVPPSYPPLVTGDSEQPGVDIELLRILSQKIGVSLVLNENQAMGRDFNPKNWGLNRAQCQVIAGGVVDSDQTRSFLETGPAYAQTGWAVVSPAPVDSLEGKRIGVLTLISGLDRIGLASFLRNEGATARILTNPDALAAGFADGTLDAGVTEAMLASRLAEENGWTVAWAPLELARYNMVFGLWKGDITLKRVVDQTFAELAADGTIGTIMDRYGVTPID
ncbi:transporter substrate-binding domain-containing protein [Devosia sp. PTR5]|uniref:Transporter substrate-binding domain-containing protein n=1 Tax=Devosia oryzisoli TaxID=2774138 RepID=A0A927FV17_9HYPH|nr:transporter substrate-binding domain-containing protein [Devosia oryzisoli]MBD8065877.1 transporter substrate-binding domain-containing protein [Devosia oryzisoli]